MATTVTMPQLGESVVEGQVGDWLVSEGQWVEKHQPLVTIMTDKTDNDIPSPEAGVLVRIAAQTGETIEVGAALCEIDSAATASPNASPPKRAPEASVPSPAQAAPAAPTPAAAPPSVRKLARDKGIDLAALRGTGEGGRITRDDVLSAASPTVSDQRGTPAAAPPPPRPLPAPTALAPTALASGSAPSSGAFKLPPYQARPGDEVVPFSRRRRIIADHMVYSKLTSPHVVTFAETDIHRTSRLRDAHKKALKAEGINLTFLSFVAAATCRALREFRAMNARVLDQEYVLLKEINLGIAVETEQGLVVPVIPHADELSVRGLARAIGQLADKARTGNLGPDDLAGKTFTISNPGRRGNLVGGAIISQPNVGILRMGEIKKRVVVIEEDGADTMAIHPVMWMALSYDHRIVDGVQANGFLYRIHELLTAGEFDI